MTTFASLVSSISGLTITGVNRTYTSIPESLSTADLPAQFVRLPNGVMTYAPSNCYQVGKTRDIELVICVEPLALEVADQNFDDTVAMMDYVETAIDTWNDSQTSLLVEYNVAASALRVGETDYWAVITSISARG
jgi:hypothetical protein